jgi:hypothetical protein
VTLVLTSHWYFNSLSVPLKIVSRATPGTGAVGCRRLLETMYNLNYIHQQLWGYKVEEKLYLGVREQKRLNITVLEKSGFESRQVLGYYYRLCHFPIDHLPSAAWCTP